MTDRRKYWDDELLDAVQRELNRTLPVDRPVMRLYNVIAAVEDGLGDSAALTRVDATMLRVQLRECCRDLAEAETAIQQVRELCQSAIDECLTDAQEAHDTGDDYYLSDAGVARAAMANRILRVLKEATDEPC